MAAPTGPGGGGGGPVGFSNSFTGPATAIELLGDHCYAYSGDVNNAGTSSADSVMLDFTTGNYYSVVAFNFSVDREGTGTYDVHIKLNGSRIYNSEFDGSPSHGIWENPVLLIIPAYTRLEFLYGCNQTVDAQVIMTGRIYR
jgi:hypothetical protein